MPINFVDTVKVKYNFEGDNNTELSIKKDDIIDVLVIDPSGWADGIIRSKKKRGWFPMQYTKSIMNKEKIIPEQERNGTENNSNNDNDISSMYEKCRLNEKLSSNWKKKRTINGKKYYINIETNETTYNKNRTLRKNDISQINKELQSMMLNDNSSSKPQMPPPPVKKSEKIMNLANLISSSLSTSSMYNLNTVPENLNSNNKSSSVSNLNAPDNLNSNKSCSINNINAPLNNTNENEKNEDDEYKPATSSLPNSFGKSSNSATQLPSVTQINFYSNPLGGESESSSLTNSKNESCCSLSSRTLSNPNGINMTAIATAAASVISLGHKSDHLSTENIYSDFSLKKLPSPALSSYSSLTQLPNPANLVDRIKKLELAKNGLTKKSGVDKNHQKIIQLFVDFIQNINKNKKNTYLEQCNDIKNALKKLLISANILNQEGTVITTTSSQINLYYSTMLSLSKMILNVRDAVGQWPPPDANQMIFMQIDEFSFNYQHLLNTINFATIVNAEGGTDQVSPSPSINTSPTFLTATVENNSNSKLSKINQQISIIMMSISDLIIVSRKESTINPTIYNLSIDCRDNISTLAKDIDEIQLKKIKTFKIISQFIHKKEILMNSIKELTITINSANEKFAPSNSLELILESLSNCINIIDDIAFIIRGLIDNSEGSYTSQYNSIDAIESCPTPDTYEQSKKMFGEQFSSGGGTFKKLDFMRKKKEPSEVKSAIEVSPDYNKQNSLNEKLGYKGQLFSEASLIKDQQKIQKTKSNPRVAIQARSKINKFFGDDNADIVNEKLNNNAAKPWYLMNDYSKGSITYNMEGQINGATFTSFIEYVTSHENDNPELDQRTLILMYDQFCSSLDFIDCLKKRYFIKAPIEIPKENIQEWKEVKQIPIQNKVLNIINLWLSDYWSSKDSEHLPTIINFLTEISNPINQSYSDSAIDILFKAKKMLVSQVDTKVTNNDNCPHPIIPKFPLEKITFLDIDPVEFTRQMCLLEMENYTKVHPHDLMIANKKNCKSESIKMMTKISIRITQFIISTILSDMDPKKRNTYLRHSINVCKKSFEERNFDLVFSIIAALNSSAIMRLSKTWSLLPSKYKDILEACQNQISHNKNYQKYRHLLKTCEKPCIPFFGIILKDITFTEDGNSKYRSENLINISKFRNLAMIAEECNSFKVPYNFKEVSVLQNWLRINIIDVEEKDEQDLYNLSLKVEPREQTLTSINNP